MLEKPLNCSLNPNPIPPFELLRDSGPLDSGLLRILLSFKSHASSFSNT